MTHRSSWTYGALILTTLLGATACSSSTSGGTGGNGGGGTTTGHGGHGGGASTSSSTSSSSGDTCHGDAATWMPLTTGPIACTSNADCCVIINGCLSQAQIVSAASKDQAKAAWPYCDSMCNDCIPPAIEVGCENGTCVGTVVDFADASTDLLMDHCGVNTPIGATPGKLHFGCGGG